MKVPPCLMPYLPHFQAAAKKYRLDVALLMAICMRESLGGAALTPPGPEGTGDGGHGRGLMQIDDRHHAPFIARLEVDGKPLWQKAEHNIAYGALVLRQAMDAFPGEEGLGVIAYNRGVRAVKKALARLPPEASPAERFAEADKGSAGGNYGRNVLARRLEFHNAFERTRHG